MAAAVEVVDLDLLALVDLVVEVLERYLELLHQEQQILAAVAAQRGVVALRALAAAV